MQQVTDQAQLFAQLHLNGSINIGPPIAEYRLVGRAEPEPCSRSSF